MRKLRICLVSPGEFTGYMRTPTSQGGLVYTRALARELVQRGHRVTVLSLNYYKSVDREVEVEEEEDDRYEVVGIADVTPWATAHAIYRWLRDNPQDVIESSCRDYPLAVEQLVGNTPCVVRLDSDIMSDSSGYVHALSDGATSWTQRVVEQYKSEMLSVKNADGVIVFNPLSLSLARGLKCANVTLSCRGLTEQISRGGDTILIMVGDARLKRNGIQYVPRILEGISSEASVMVVAPCLVGCGHKVERNHTEWVTEPKTEREIGEMYDDAMAVVVPALHHTMIEGEALSHGKHTICFDRGSWRQYDSHAMHYCEGRPPMAAVKMGEIATNILRENREVDEQLLREELKPYLWKNVISIQEEVYFSAIETAFERGRAIV